MTGCSVLILAVLTLGGVGLVAAQIPTICANNADLQSGRCCPNNCSGSDRGTCTQVSTMCKTNYDSTGLRENFTMDGRFNWPSQIFTEVCKCKGNYGGFNCSECKFGYKGDDCSTKTVQVRRSITDADFNWTNYREQLSRSKTEIQKRYKVYIGGNVTNETNYKEVTLYNLFAWMHHYVAWTAEEKYNPSESAYDYAHESVGFLTWHRIYLLWFEREMQILLGDADFTVRYWDWTIPANRSALFVENKLGSNDYTGEVTGDLMSNWYIVCALPNGKANKNGVCDPTPGNRHVFRCGTAGNCSHPGWPDEENVRRSLNFTNYRTIINANSKIVNKYDTMSFSNYIEGFAVDDECENSLNNCERMLLCGEDPEDLENPNRIRRRLHNLVHVLLGIKGTIGDIPIAANDPVFINHHTMIDCLFEQWLQSNHPNKEYPSMTLDPKFAGHGADDCIVPFIPVYNHSDVFNKRANDYGYACDLRSFLATPTNPPATNPPATNPPATNPPATNPPATNPPATNPPATNPPGRPGNPGNQPGNPGGGADSSLASATMLVSMLVLCLAAIAL